MQRGPVSSLRRLIEPHAVYQLAIFPQLAFKARGARGGKPHNAVGQWRTKEAVRQCAEVLFAAVLLGKGRFDGRIPYPDVQPVALANYARSIFRKRGQCLNLQFGEVAQSQARNTCALHALVNAKVSGYYHAQYLKSAR